MSASAQNKTSSLFRVRVSNQDQVHIAYVPMERFTIGSLPNLPVTLHDKSVDKNHLLISCVDGQILLTDQNSTNGTLINSARIAPGVATVYNPGDTVVLGTSAYSLQIHLFVQGKVTESAPKAPFKDEALLKKTQEDIDALMKAAQIRGEEHAAKIASAHLARLMEQVKKDNEVFREDYQHKAILAAQAEAETILQKAQVDSLAFKQEAQNTALRLMDEAKKVEIAASQFAHEQATQHMQKLIAQSAELRKRTESEVSELSKAAGLQIQLANKEAKESADQFVERSRQQAQDIINQARTEGELRLEESWKTSLKIQQEAQKEAGLLTESILAQSEAKSVDLFKAREQKAQGIRDEAFQYAEKIVQAARDEALKVQRAEALKMSEERSTQLAKTLSDANVAGEELKVAARAEADRTTDAARATSDEIIGRAEAQANQIMNQSKRLIIEIQTTAREEAERFLAETRTECTASLQKQERENRQLLEDARAAAANLVLESQTEIKALRAQSERDEQERQTRSAKELQLRRTQVETELENQRRQELERIGRQWKVHLQMADNKKHQEIQLLMKNIELGLPAVLQNAVTQSLTDEDRDAIFQSLREMVDLAFSPHIEMKIPVEKPSRTDNVVPFKNDDEKIAS